MAKNNNTKNGKKVPVTFLEEDEGKQEETKETKSKSWISVLNCEGCKSISECHKALLQGKVIDATVKCYKDWTDEEKDALPKTIKSALDYAVPKKIIMFDRINIKALKHEWQNFDKSNEYKDRMEQTKFCRVAKLIIEELVKKKKIKNDHLTALIQMFAWNCSEDNFNKYLGKLEFASGIKKKILHELNDVKEKGYTGRGKAAIRGLNEKQLAAVKNLLKFVLEAQNVEQVKDAIKEFREANIPYVKVGIYSPWLYYVKPNTCPLVTSKRKTFLKKLGWKDEEDYSAAIDLFIEMSKTVGEKDLGLLDAFLEDEDRQNRIIKKNKNDTPSDDAHDNRNLDAIFNAIYTKPFIILSGISGTGKTQIARIISAALVKGEKNE